MKRFYFLLPILIGIFFVLSFYSRNIAFVEFELVWFSLIMSGVFSLVVFGLSYLICRKGIVKSLVFSSLVIAMVFSYGYLGKFTFIIGAIAVGVIFMAQKYFTKSVATLLAVVSLCLLIMPIVGIVRYTRDSSIPSERFEVNGVADVEKPSLYYIILDSYASNRTLDTFGYDNTDFTQFLSDNGFYVAENSFCNYPRTYASLASSLNMEYLDINNLSFIEVANRIKHNEVVKILKGKGYDFVNVGSTYKYSRVSEYADKNYLWGDAVKNDFSLYFYSTTVFPLITPDVDFVGIERETVLYQWDMLEKIPTTLEEPTFVFAHILAPHHYYPMFTSNGDVLVATEETTQEDIYFNFLDYTNKRMKEVISSIIDNSKEPPIVILQSDEGINTSDFLKYIYGDNGEITNPAWLKQKAYILNAYYSPDSIDGLYDGISPVNSFRLIFNQYFGKDYELLSDRYYFPKVFASNEIGVPSKDWYDATELIK